MGKETYALLQQKKEKKETYALCKFSHVYGQGWQMPIHLSLIRYHLSARSKSTTFCAHGSSVSGPHCPMGLFLFGVQMLWITRQNQWNTDSEGRWQGEGPFSLLTSRPRPLGIMRSKQKLIIKRKGEINSQSKLFIKKKNSQSKLPTSFPIFLRKKPLFQLK